MANFVGSFLFIMDQVEGDLGIKLQYKRKTGITYEEKPVNGNSFSYRSMTYHYYVNCDSHFIGLNHRTVDFYEYTIKENDYSDYVKNKDTLLVPSYCEIKQLPNGKVYVIVYPSHIKDREPKMQPVVIDKLDMKKDITKKQLIKYIKFMHLYDYESSPYYDNDFLGFEYNWLKNKLKYKLGKFILSILKTIVILKMHTNLLKN